MAEYIDRDELKEALLRRGFYPTFVKAALESLPAIDIVRCKDCKYYGRKYGDRDIGYCCHTKQHGYCDSDHFCSYGERRDG